MKRFLSTLSVCVLTALWVAVAVGPAAASQVDSWGGHVFIHHETDVLAYPHRALEFPNSATLVYVPPTSTAADFHRAPADKQEVAGVITFGGYHWSGIVAGNAPNAFNPVQAYDAGSNRGWGASLTRGDVLGSHLVRGLDSSYSPQAMPSMQVGAAFQATDDVRVGLSFQQFGQEWTDTSMDSVGVDEKVGFDISGLNFTTSGEVQLNSVLKSIEGVATYGTSDQEGFSPIDGQGGKGDASTFSLGLTLNWGDLGLIDSKYGFNYQLRAQYDDTNSSFTDDLIDTSTDPPAMVEDDCYMYDIRIGLTHLNEGIFSTSVGVQGLKDEETNRSIVNTTFTEERKAISMPTCDAAGEVPLWKNLSMDYGMMVAWWRVETTQTSQDATGMTTARNKEVDTTGTTSYHAGFVWRPREDFRISLTLDTDQLGDPGGVVFGNNNDASVIAIGAKYGF